MAWVDHTDHDDAFETIDGLYEAVPDPVYGHYLVRLVEAPCQSLGEAVSLVEAHSITEAHRAQRAAA